jgi:hypothetical protein
METFLKNFTQRHLQIYNEVKSEPIEYILLCKHPLRKLITKVLGSEFHHVYLIIVLKNSHKFLYFGVHYSSLRLSDKIVIRPNTKSVVVHISPDLLTIHDMFQNYVKKYGGVFSYKASDYNCQHFIVNILRTSKLLTKSHEKFLLETRIHSLLTKKKPRTNNALNRITSVYNKWKLKYNQYTKRKKNK